MASLIERISSAFRGDSADVRATQAVEAWLDSTQMRLDGWSSSQLGLGGYRDKSTMMSFQANGRLSPQTKDQLWRGSGLVQKIINKPTDDALRAGIDIRHKQAEELQDALRQDDFDFWTMASKGLKLADAQGGAVYLMDVNDGQNDLTQPVNEDKIKWVRSWFQEPIHAFYARPLVYSAEYVSDVYRVQFSNGQSVDIHKSRMLVFDGIYAGPWNRYNNWGWNESIIDIIYEPLRNFESDHGASSTLVKDFTQSVIKLAGFDGQTRANSSNAVEGARQRMKAMEVLRSVVNAVVLDSNEEFQRYSTTVTGLSELIEIGKSYLATVTNIPRTILFGEQPNASIGGQGGVSQRQDWHDTVSDRQQQRIRMPLAKALRYKGREIGIKDPIPFDFNPLMQPSAKEQAETRKLTSEADALDIANKVVTASQVAVSRYGSGEYSTQMILPDAVVDRLRIEAEETPQEQSDRKASEVAATMGQTAPTEETQDAESNLNQEEDNNGNP